MKKRFRYALLSTLLAALIWGCAPEAAAPVESSEPEEKVVLYTAMREDVIQAIEQGFEEANPGVDLECYNAASDTVLNRIYTEAQAGQVAADVLWVGDERDCQTFRELDIIRKYVSSQTETAVGEKYKDPEGYYAAGRITALGMAINTDLMPKERLPQSWAGMVDPRQKGQVSIVDPALSHAADYWVNAIVSNEDDDYGALYIKRLKRNECHLESSFASLLEKVRAGERIMGVCPDYMAAELMEEGAPITFIYPKDTVVVVTPLALVKESANMANGRLLYDYILSKEGQELLAECGFVSVRDDVLQRASPAAIARRSMDCETETLSTGRASALALLKELWGV